MVERLKVYLVWDNSREEHGEGPTLLDVCATRGVAEMTITRQAGDDDEYNELFSVEVREVRE